MKILILVCIITTLFIIGCDNRKEMQNRFDNGALIMTDQNGKQYVAEHHILQTYTLAPIITNKNSE